MWDSQAGSYDKRLGFLRWTQRKLVSFIGLEDSPVLLDMACGTGWAVRYAADSTQGHGEFYGIDYSAKMIDQAKINLAPYPNAHFYKASVEKLPFENDFFDVIICSNAYHHFAEPDKAVKEAYRVLKPQGKFYVLDETADSFLIRILDKLAGKLEPGHVKLYSTKEFRTSFQNAGFFTVPTKSILWSVKIHCGVKAV